MGKKSSVCTLLVFLMFGNFVHCEELWCYECNTDLSMGIKKECNDPYAPGPAMDLVSCPQNEPHHCLKAIIYHKNVYATMRGCVPSRTRTTYCSHHDVFTEARVTCKFCNDYACNRSIFSKGIDKNTVKFILTIVLSTLVNNV